MSMTKLGKTLCNKYPESKENIFRRKERSKVLNASNRSHKIRTDQWI